jgi:general secretion pathway protein I
MVQGRQRTEADNAGFTLLEVLLAIALLAIALPVLLGLRNFDLDLQDRASELRIATLLAQEKLVEVELLGQYAIGETVGEFRHVPLGVQPVTHTDPRAVGYRWKQTIAPTPLELIREIRIKVTWPRSEREESLEVSTYVFAGRLTF